jgi:hypothetical protein
MFLVVFNAIKINLSITAIYGIPIAELEGQLCIALE